MYRALGLLALTFIAASPALAEDRYRIAVIGTGSMGSALGERLANAGHSVVYGSRDPARQKVKDIVKASGADATATTQRDAARQAGIVILAVPWSAVEALIPALGDLSGKIVVDITTGDRQAADGYPELAVETSTSELIQAWAPSARVVKTPFASEATVRDPLRHGEPTVTYIAADDRGAKEVVARLALQLDLFPLDAGPLRMARSIDHLAFLYLTPMMQGRAHTWTLVPRVDADFSCISTEGWFEPVRDEGDLANFPNLAAVDVRCESPSLPDQASPGD